MDNDIFLKNLYGFTKKRVIIKKGIMIFINYIYKLTFLNLF